MACSWGPTPTFDAFPSFSGRAAFRAADPLFSGPKRFIAFRTRLVNLVKLPLGLLAQFLLFPNRDDLLLVHIRLIMDQLVLRDKVVGSHTACSMRCMIQSAWETSYQRGVAEECYP